MFEHSKTGQTENTMCICEEDDLGLKQGVLVTVEDSFWSDTSFP